MAPLILDVREKQIDCSSPSSAVEAIVEGLCKPKGTRTLPSLLLYNNIRTKTPEYHPFACGEQVLTDYADEIVKAMGVGKRDGEVLIELGAGALRKTSHFLLTLARAARVVEHGTKPSTSYFALNPERAELAQTLDELSASIGPALADRVSLGGIWGTYNDGIAFVNRGVLNQDQDTALKLDDTEAEAARGRAAKRPQAVHNTQPTPSPSDSDNPSSSAKDCLTAPSASEAAASAAQAPTCSAFPTPPSSESSPSLDRLATNPNHLLFLGSSIGRFPPEDAAKFLRSLPLRVGSGDTLLLGLDQKNDPELVRLACDGSKGHTRDSALNSLANAASITDGLIDVSKWGYEEKFNEELASYEGYYRSNVKQTLTLPATLTCPTGKTIELEEGELVKFEYGYKYSDADAVALFAAADLRIVRRWRNSNKQYSLWLLERAPFTFPIPSLSNSPTTSILKKINTPAMPSKNLFSPVPTRDEWLELWKAWDTITLGMIPRELLHEKPIHLRHKCLFYLGHIPTFLDIHLTRLLNGNHTEPEYFKDIFERGIDPQVDDPSSIHPHSEVPEKDEDWPTRDEIIAFKSRVRARVMSLYDEFDSGMKTVTRKIGRVLWMTYEHETLHLETILYMLIQRAGSGTIPPPTITPDWDTLASVWDKEVATTAGAPALVRIGPAEISIGHDDFEAEDTSAPEQWQSDYEFGWDNEHPKRIVSIGAVDVSTRPITNGEYMAYLTSISQTEKIPASWVRVEGETLVRTLYGPVKFNVAKHWPLTASYDEILGYAQSKGGRLPTEYELVAFKDARDDLCGPMGNIAFRNWHYVPPYPSSDQERGHNGGVWEWTSTLMHAHEGYVASTLYPGFSADFHDEKHHIVLSGSFAAVPRVAMRRSHVGFFQHNYPYAWVGGRVCFDVHDP